MPSVVISQPMYFPWPGLFEQMALADIFVHYDDVQLPQGRSFITRVQVKTARGSQWLTVPVRTKGRGLQPIRDVEIDDQQRWRKQHLGMLAEAYAKAPFFGDAMEIATAVLDHRTRWLWELNCLALERVATYFGLRPRCMHSSEFGFTTRSSEKLLDIVKALDGNRYISGHGALNYLNHELFETHGVDVEYMDYERRPYPQLHGPFDPHVTILDLIANCGTAGRDYICSTSSNWKHHVQERN